MFAALVTMGVKAGKDSDAHRLLSRMTEHLKQQKGYIMTVMLHSVEDATDRGAVVLWRTRQDADAAMNSNTSLAIMYEVLPLLEGPLVSSIYEVHSDRKEVLGA